MLIPTILAARRNWSALEPHHDLQQAAESKSKNKKKGPGGRKKAQTHHPIGATKTSGRVGVGVFGESERIDAMWGLIRGGDLQKENLGRGKKGPILRVVWGASGGGRVLWGPLGLAFGGLGGPWGRVFAGGGGGCGCRWVWRNWGREEGRADCNSHFTLRLGDTEPKGERKNLVSPSCPKGDCG